MQGGAQEPLVGDDGPVDLGICSGALGTKLALLKRNGLLCANVDLRAVLAAVSGDPAVVAVSDIGDNARLRVLLDRLGELRLAEPGSRARWTQVAHDRVPSGAHCAVQTRGRARAPRWFAVTYYRHEPAQERHRADIYDPLQKGGLITDSWQYDHIPDRDPWTSWRCDPSQKRHEKFLYERYGRSAWLRVFVLDR